MARQVPPADLGDARSDLAKQVRRGGPVTQDEDEGVIRGEHVRGLIIQGGAVVVSLT
jgi:hypothetical protein